MWTSTNASSQSGESPAYFGGVSIQRGALGFSGWGTGELGMTNTLWKCEQLRAGEVYCKELFDTKAEAEEFAAKLARVAPDIFCRIEPVGVETVWN